MNYQDVASLRALVAQWSAQKAAKMSYEGHSQHVLRHLVESCFQIRQHVIDLPSCQRRDRQLVSQTTYKDGQFRR